MDPWFLRCGQEANLPWARQNDTPTTPDGSARVDRIRKLIARGHYPAPHMVEIAVDRLMTDLARDGGSGAGQHDASSTRLHSVA